MSNSSGMFSVYDSKGDVWSTPFFSRNALTARREFERAVNTPGHIYASSPMDYTLAEIGTFNEEHGIVSAMIHERVATALELVEREG